MRKYAQATLTAAVAVMLLAGPASAAGTWAPANSGASLKDGVVTLDNTDADATPLGTSFENTDVDQDLEAGDLLSFEYRILDNSECGGGQPRIFVQIDENYYNSFDGNPGQCGSDDDGDGWFTVTYEVPVSGNAGHAGVVYDNISDRGIAEFRNIVVGTPIFPSNASECKKGGWELAGYKNQGACVSAFASAK